MSSDNYTAIVLEEIRDQNRAVLEAVSQMQTRMHLLATQASLEAVATDVTTIKAAVNATNHDLTSLDTRVSTLEQAA